MLGTTTIGASLFGVNPGYFGGPAAILDEGSFVNSLFETGLFEVELLRLQSTTLESGRMSSHIGDLTLRLLSAIPTSVGTEDDEGVEVEIPNSAVLKLTSTVYEEVL